MSELKELFKEAEENIKMVEILMGEFQTMPINQLRYCAYHLLKYDEDKSSEHLKRATRHVQRAIYDCGSLLTAYVYKYAAAFREDYKTISISNFIPEYNKYRQELEAAKNIFKNYKLIGGREESGKPIDNFQQAYDACQKVKNISEIFEIARDDLNAELNKQLWGKRMGVINVTAVIVLAIVAVVGLGIGVLTYLDNKEKNTKNAERIEVKVDALKAAKK